VQRWSLSEVLSPVIISVGRDSGWPLLTSGHYSQVVVNTGLAVQSKNIPNNSFITD
jgi:hypothetical protein